MRAAEAAAAGTAADCPALAAWLAALTAAAAGTVAQRPACSASPQSAELALHNIWSLTHALRTHHPPLLMLPPGTQFADADYFPQLIASGYRKLDQYPVRAIAAQMNEVYSELLNLYRGKAHLAEGQQAQACSDPLPALVPGLPEPQSLSLQALLPAPDLAVASVTQAVPVAHPSQPQTCKACPSCRSHCVGMHHIRPVLMHARHASLVFCRARRGSETCSEKCCFSTKSLCGSCKQAAVTA